jgi:hypothetical protein
MTQYETINLSLQFITFITISIALFYNYKQMRATKEQAKAATAQTGLLSDSIQRSTYIDFEASLLEVSKSLIQHPNVRPYLYDKKPLPARNNDDYNLVVSFCVFYLDFFDHVLTMEQISPHGTQWGKSNWEAWIMDMFNCSPSLRKVYLKERHWYAPALGVIADKAFSQNDESRSSPAN